ncbi:MAG: G5 domain-containing protein [Acutalibacter sp.]
MHGRHMKKAPRLLAIRGVAALILVLALSISSFATVMANTVSANVIDGDQSYTFNMSSTDLDEILEQAEEMGLEPLGPLDVAERVEGTTTVVVRRGVNLTVREAGKENLLVAYRGDTVEQVLLENSIVLKDADEITPARETVVEGDTQVEIRRACQVVVLADGKQTTVTQTGGTVEDALKEAGVTVGEEDSLNYDKDEPLFDKMHIRVTRVMKVRITAGGEIREVETSAQTVEDVLKKFQVELDEDDRVEPEAKTKVAEGMEITVRRVEVKEEVKTEEVPFETQYQDTDSLYEGETQVKTQGVAGEKEVTYQVTFVDGEEESREAASEKVTKEPVAEVVLRGTAEREQSGAGGSGTFVDLYGNTVSYSSVMSGTCTAYSVPGGTTSLGWDAVYGVIAVNPNIIPYGTKMYVTSPDGSVVYGYGVAGDTGGACMAGDIIADLCYNTIEECSQIGRREMVIYILS